MVNGHPGSPGHSALRLVELLTAVSRLVDELAITLPQRLWESFVVGNRNTHGRAPLLSVVQVCMMVFLQFGAL